MIPIDRNNFEDAGVFKNQLIQSAIMDQEVQPITNIYFDLMCLKDIKLGSLLFNILQNNKKDEYQYLLTKIEDYNNRKDHALMYYFPDLPYKEEYILSCLQDPKIVDRIFVISPTTACYENLRSILLHVKKHNDHTDKSLPINVTINIHPFPITNLIKKFLFDVIKSICPTFKLSLIVKKLKYISPTVLSDASKNGLIFKMLFVYDLWDSFFADDSNLKTSFTQDMFLQKASVFGPKFLQVPLHTIPHQDEALSTLDLMENYMNICCSFKYINFPIILQTKDTK